MQVNLLIGANAYACISENGRKTDILLSPGKGASQSLREFAQEQRARAARIADMASLAERAADKLESDKGPQYIKAGERLWNGAIASHCLAMAYNAITDRIAEFEREGRKVPDEVLNGRHNLIASAI